MTTNSSTQMPSRPIFAVAPMLDWTDRHCRWFHRQLSRHAMLYTEMVTTGAIIHGNRDALLGFSECEHPVVLQLGGSDPAELAQSIRIAQAYGYDEFNLNCGCPSDRVQKGAFGASMMLNAQHVAQCFVAMQEATTRPVTVKHRIGIDDQDSYAFVQDFVGTLWQAGCKTFIVHTRSAWLKGLSPKENREIPPLKREYAYRLKQDFPEATIVVNGAIDSIETCVDILAQGVDGVMVGRAAYHEPWMLTKVDEVLFGEEPFERTRADVVHLATQQLRAQWRDDRHAIRAYARHMNGLMQGLPGARHWRRALSDPQLFKENPTEILEVALSMVQSPTLRD